MSQITTPSESSIYWGKPKSDLCRRARDTDVGHGETRWASQSELSALIRHDNNIYTSVIPILMILIYLDHFTDI